MGAWIEIQDSDMYDICARSHPTMGAWIEIAHYFVDDDSVTVAPHDGCVD